MLVQTLGAPIGCPTLGNWQPYVGYYAVAFACEKGATTQVQRQLASRSSEDGQVAYLPTVGRCWQHATALSMASGTF